MRFPERFGSLILAVYFHCLPNVKAGPHRMAALGLAPEQTSYLRRAIVPKAWLSSSTATKNTAPEIKAARYNDQ